MKEFIEHKVDILKAITHASDVIRKKLKRGTVCYRICLLKNKNTGEIISGFITNDKDKYKKFKLVNIEDYEIIY